MNKKLFLLGGYDLEMEGIRKLLLASNGQPIDEMLNGNGLLFADRNLKWGAKLSSYVDLLDFVGTIYGVELEEDIPAPNNYKRVDHHNELDKLPSSIEQVAVLLGTTLTREETLVAANDKGFIPAMKSIGATDGEISHIRLLDRRAQGVTEEDEKLAEESIAQNLSSQGGVTIIKSLVEKFSPITDRLYGKAIKLVVYNADKVVYYGPGINILSRRLDNWIKDGKAYYGGGNNGYFGVKEKVFSKREIETDVISTLVKCLNNE